jgi:hypothetical protein
VARVLGVLIVVLALVDGLVHLSIDAFVTHSFAARYTNVLFLLNFLGYVVLVVAFVWAQRGSPSVRRLVDAVLIVYPLAALVAWEVITAGRGNPRLAGVPLGLAQISKPAEILLALAALAHVVSVGQGASPSWERQAAR